MINVLQEEIFYCSATRRNLKKLIADGVSMDYPNIDDCMENWDFICVSKGKIHDFVNYWNNIHLKYKKQYQLDEGDSWVLLGKL